MNVRFTSPCEKSSRWSSVKKERRKFVRFEPVKGAFLVFRPEFAKLGRIQDISMGGLGYRYTVAEGMEGSPECPVRCEIDIFLSGNQFYLRRLPCRVAYDIRVKNDQQDPPDVTLESKRCGLQFMDAAKSDPEKLKFFLDNHTTRTL